MFYIIARFVMSLYTHFVYRIKVIHPEKLPKTGGVVLCSNHISNLDPIVLAIALKRPVHFMAKKELFKNPFYAKVLKGCNAFPVDRNSVDMSSYNNTLQLLRDGKMVGIFAQGTRMSEVESKSAKSGVSLFSLKANVPVVPVGIVTEYKFRGTVKIYIGDPMEFPEYQGKKLKTDILNQVTEK